MKEEFPEVLAAAMVQGPRSAIISLTHQSEEKVFEEDEGVAFVDAEFFEVFDYRLITSGDFNSLDEPNKVVLARKLASKFFRGIAPEEVVGQTIRYNDTYSLQVVGIVEDIPYHTDLPFQMLISQKTREHDLPPPSWGRIESDVQLYLVLNGPIDIEEFDKRINDMVLRNTSERYVSRMELHLQPFSTIHYDGRFGNFNERTVSKETIWSIALIGFVLLITACINFINLATAQSIKRAKEIGIRKVMGSNKGGIIAQMLTETTFLVLVASFFGLTAAYLFLPDMANLLNLRLDASYFLDVNVAIFSFILAVAVILLSGFYPGWVLSRFNPLTILKGNLSGSGKGGLWLRRILVIFQFASSQALIIGTIVVSTQMDYFSNKNLGFNRESILMVPLPEGFSQTDALLNEWSKITSVENVTLQTAPPSSPNRWMTGYTFPGADPNDRYFAEMKMADENYLETYQLELLAGRNYLRMDTAGEALINEKMALEIGYQSPAEAIGNKVEAHRGRLSTIVGVVKDFHTVSLQEELIPVVISPMRETYSEVGIKFRADQIASTLSGLEESWYKLLPDERFDYEFLDDSLALFYENEQRTAKIFNAVTLIAIFIGCLGLYGLISFMTNNRLKEVGIRKTLGAGTGSIIHLFSSEFVRLVLAAFILAAPLGYYYMDVWLQDFAFRIDLDIWMFAAALGASLAMALATISYRSYLAAKSNPVETLRYE